MNNEEKNRLREVASRLFQCRDIAATQDMLSILSECLFKIFNEHRNVLLNDRPKSEARIIAQMIFTKTVNLNKMMDGFSFVSIEDVRLNKVVDPTLVAVLVRNIFETVAMFNLVYMRPQNNDEKLIHYNLWVISGLKFRQRFANCITNEENAKKQKDEESIIEKKIKEIYETSLFKSLPSPGQKTIINKIKDKDYKIGIDGEKVTSLSWQDLITSMGVRENLMGDMYTYFSLYAHPSNVSVFQFADLFSSENYDFINIANFDVINAIQLVSCFIYDYIKLFPDALNTFNDLPIEYQLAINFHCMFSKSDNATINNALNILD